MCLSAPQGRVRELHMRLPRLEARGCARVSLTAGSVGDAPSPGSPDRTRTNTQNTPPGGRPGGVARQNNYQQRIAMNTSEVLYRAADLIEERGWGQGPRTWSSAQGEGICLEGAIGAAMGLRVNGWSGDGGITPDELNFKCEAGLAVRRYLELALTYEESTQRTDGTAHWLCHWNDAIGRTPAEVIEVLRAAAVIEAARESEAAQVSA